MIQQFLKRIWFPGTSVQVGEIKTAELVDFDKVESWIEARKTKNLYFLGGVRDDVTGRAKDDDISLKTYVCFDFDIRKEASKKGVEATDEQIKNWGKKAQKLLESSTLKDFGAIVFTGNGVHIYYFCSPREVTGKASIYAGGYQNICKELEELLGVSPDLSCSNLARILRLPGSWNNKSIPGKKVDFLFFDPEKESELLAEILEYVPEVKKDTSLVPLVTGGDFKGENFWSALAKIHNRLVLERLSGSKFVNGEVYTFRKRTVGGEHVDVNGEPADAWIDVAGYIGSGKGGGPTWIQWLHEYFKVSYQDIASWAKVNLKDILPSRLLDGYSLMDAGAFYEEILQQFESQKKTFTWGTPELDKQFSPLVPHRYVVLVGESGTGKTAYAFYWALQNALNGHRVVYLSLEMSPASLLHRYVTRFMGLPKKLVEALTPTQLERVKEIVDRIRLPNLLFNHENKENFSVNTIKKIVEQNKPDIIFIDNMGFVEALKGEDEREKFNIISREIVKICQDNAVSIITLHHFNKSTGRGLKEESPRPLSAILGTAKIEHDVDYVLQVWRALMPHNILSDTQKQELSVLLMKDRFWGEPSTQVVYHHNAHFYDYPRL